MPIPSDVYDRDYFLSDRCEGYDRFQQGGGLSDLKLKLVELTAPRPGERILDAGCGRAEVLAECRQRGAEVAGIDYSEAAIEISRETLPDVPADQLLQGDVTALPWEDASFDAVIFGDVIEHLDREQTAGALREFHRVLKPGGRLVIHTAPNLYFLRFVWPVARQLLRISDPETVSQMDGWIAESKTYHVNEQSVHTLGRSVREAGFREPRAWVASDVLRSGGHHLTAEINSHPLARLARTVLATRPVRMFAGNDLYAIGIR